MGAPTTFKAAGGLEFVVRLDELAVHRLIGAGLLSTRASGEDFLGRYDRLINSIARSRDDMATCMAAVCRRQVDEYNLGHQDFMRLFRDDATRLAAFDAFVSAARLEHAANETDIDGSRTADPTPIGDVSKA